MWKKTRLTDALGLKLPIIQAPMAGGITTPELVAAVSNAGCLGSLGAGYMSPTEIRETIKQIHNLTDKPFSVNLFIEREHHATLGQLQRATEDIKQSCLELTDFKIESPLTSYTQNFKEQMNVILEERVPVVSFTFGALNSTWISQLKNNNTILIGTATTLAEACVLEASGVDMIVAQGSEAGGHRGTFLGEDEDALIGSVSLVPQLADQIKIPIIAAGGIADGRGIIASLSLGATGVQMGTAFLTCIESNAHPKYKQTLMSQKQYMTVLTRAFSGKLARAIQNKFITRMDVKKKNILDYPIQNALTSKMRKKAKELGHVDFMSLWAGQSAQLCRSVSAGELIDLLVTEADDWYNQICDCNHQT